MKHGGAAWIPLLIFACAALVGSQSATAFSLPYSDRIRTSGYVEYSGRINATANQPNSINNSTTVRINAATYLWRPWVAQVDGGIGLTYTSVSNANSQTGRSINGEVNLHLFPRSNFPFTGFFQRLSNVIEGDVTGADLISTNLGFNQSVTGYLDTVFNLSYQRSLTTENNLNASNLDREDTDDSLEFSAARRYEDHSFNLGSSYDRLARSTPEQTNDRFVHVLRHAYRPDSHLSINNLMTYNSSTTANLNNENNLSLFQLNSNAFWQPETKRPLSITGNALLQSQTVSVGSGSGPANRTLDLGGRANYQWSPHMNFRAQTSVNVSQVEDNNRISTLQGLGVDYSPAEKPFWGFTYSYTLAADATNRTDEAGSQQDISTNAGHVVSKSLPLFSGNLSLTASQRGATSLNSGGELDRTLTHTISSGWSRSVGNSSAFLRATLTDSRRSGRDEGGLQLFDFQASLNHSVSRDVSWDANANFQVSRPLDDEIDAVDMNSSLNFSYKHRRLFGVRQLSFDSELRYLTNSLLNIVRSEGLDVQERDESFWRNKLNYVVGRLQIRLNADMTQSNGQISSSLFLQVRRNFGY